MVVIQVGNLGGFSYEKKVLIIILACILLLGITIIISACKTKYKPCEELSAYANRLLNNENANIILEDPPILTVISDETTFDTLLGTYSWQKKNSDGTFTHTESDSAHPLDCEDLFFKYETTETTATLNFAENPDAILSVQCWSEDYWATHGTTGESVTIDEYEIEAVG